MTVEVQMPTKLPPKNEIIGAYKHFLNRLYERYGMYITYEEWLSLGTKECVVVYQFSNRKKIVYLSIQDRIVLAYKQYGKKGRIGYCITALPRDSKQYWRYRREMDDCMEDKKEDDFSYLNRFDGLYNWNTIY